MVDESAGSWDGEKINYVGGKTAGDGPSRDRGSEVRGTVTGLLKGRRNPGAAGVRNNRGEYLVEYVGDMSASVYSLDAAIKPPPELNSTIRGGMENHASIKEA